MSATRTESDLPQFVPALCCECGEVRQAGFRNASAAPERLLKCSACRRRTTHAVIAPEGWDVKEERNRRADGPLIRLARATEHMDKAGMWVTYGRPQGGRCELRHYLDGDAPEWRVVVADHLDTRERLRMLEWAWKNALPSWEAYAESFGGDVCSDKYGEFRGCYYTGR